LFAGIYKFLTRLSSMSKKKTSIALDSELIVWVDKMVDLKRFASLTHAVEYGLQRLKENEKQELHTPG